MCLSRVFAAALVAGFLALSARTPPAAAGEAEEAKALFQKGTGEFGVGNYEQAAAHYEAAFRLRPDAALLFNAAQAYRLAGKKQRAIEIYKNFLRIYRDAPQAAEAKRQIAALNKQIAEEPASQTRPAPVLLPIGTPAPPAGAPEPPPLPSVAAPAPPRPIVSTPPAPAPLPPPAPRAAPAVPPHPAVSLVVAPAWAPAAPAREDSSIFRKPWLWVGVVVVLLGAAALVIATRPSYPDPTFGVGDGA